MLGNLATWAALQLGLQAPRASRFLRRDGEQGDDFDFVAGGHLFQTPLLYMFSSGQIGIDTTFQELAAQFSSTTGFGDAPAATRRALAAFLARM